MSLMIVGCLKDEDFEDQRYGLQVPEVISVSFPQQPTSPVTIGIVSQATSQEVTGPLLALNSVGPSSSPVTVALATDDALVTSDPELTLMPAGSYSVNSMNVTIPAGEMTSDAVKITIPDATVLDPTKKYGIGFKITSSDQGYQIAKNMSSVVIAFAIKNQYDGVYSYVSGTVTRYTSPGVPAGDALSGPLSKPPNADVEMITTGPNTVNIVGLSWSGGAGVGGIDGLTATVDPATNLVTMASSQNATLTNWAGKENKYDPATKTFHLAFRWNPAANTREYEVVFKYEGPR